MKIIFQQKKLVRTSLAAAECGALVQRENHPSDRADNEVYIVTDQCDDGKGSVVRLRDGAVMWWSNQEMVVALEASLMVTGVRYE